MYTFSPVKEKLIFVFTQLQRVLSFTASNSTYFWLASSPLKSDRVDHWYRGGNSTNDVTACKIRSCNNYREWKTIQIVSMKYSWKYGTQHTDRAVVMVNHACRRDSITSVPSFVFQWLHNLLFSHCIKLMFPATSDLVVTPMHFINWLKKHSRRTHKR